MRLAALLVLAATGTAAAEPDPPAPTELPYAQVRDGVITGVGAALYILSESLLKDAIAPDQCRWCDPPGFDASARNALKWDDTDTAHRLSSLIGFVGVPVAAFGTLLIASRHDHKGDQWLVDGLIVLQSMVLGMDLDQVVKMAAGRERPWIHALPEDEKATVPRPNENNVSFYSGHTTLAFSLATAAGVVASRRHYRAAPLVWGVGLPLAAATGYLRIAADKHWTSDVVVGALMGAAGGYLVPRLLHARRGDTQVVPTVGGVAVIGTF